MWRFRKEINYMLENEAWHHWMSPKILVADRRRKY